MAHPNILERQAKVKELLDQGVPILGAVRKELAAKFQCSASAIHADILFFTRPKTRATRFVSHSMRKRIRDRDGMVCQYCEDRNAFEYIIEHVLPASIGGEAVPHNLVVACQRCNATKRRSVWIPKNFETITDGNLEWREEIKRKATSGKQTVAEVVASRDW